MPRRETPTVAAAAAEYQETRATYVANATLANDWSILRAFARGIGPDKQIHNVTQRQVELWFAAEAKRQKPSSYNKVRTRIKGFLDFATRRGWVTLDLLGEVRTRTVTKRDRMRLSPAELLDLPKHTHSARDKAFIVTACNTALRANELVSLRVRDVDLFNGWLDTDITKSAKQDKLPITVELDAALREWFKHYEEDAGELQADWHLFPQRQPGAGRYIRDAHTTTYAGHIYGSLLPEKQMKNPAQIVQRCLTSQGHAIEPGEGVHTLRRSVARAYFDARVAAGYDGALRETSALLHHTNSQTTEIYLGLTTEKLGRDKALKGQTFLSAMVDADNVVSLGKSA
ncbi:MAG: site-specific integrase [Propionibacteriales bacterium]|nr:site-specific integrase [Propionibacteriales bacterium]